MQLSHSFVVKDYECAYCQRKEGDETESDVGFKVKGSYIFAGHKVLSRITLQKVISFQIYTEI